MKVELDLSLCSPASGLLTWCVAILNICRLHQSFSHQLLTSSTKVCNSWDPGVVSPSEALVFWSQEAAQRWDLVVIKDHFLGFEAQSAFFLKENHFWINLFNDYPIYRLLWKLLCTKQGCTVFRVSGGKFSPLLSSCKVFVTLSPRYFLHRHIVEENLHFQWPVPGYLNMMTLFHSTQYFFFRFLWSAMPGFIRVFQKLRVNQM